MSRRARMGLLAGSATIVLFALIAGAFIVGGALYAQAPTPEDGYLTVDTISDEITCDKSGTEPCTEYTRYKDKNCYCGDATKDCYWTDWYQL